VPVTAERRRSQSFAPTAVVGLASAALTAVAASRDWVTASGVAAGVRVTASVKGSSSAPLAVSLALLALAAWGVVLVLRGTARRVVAVVGALAAAGVVVTVLTSFGTVRDAARSAVAAKGGTGAQVVTSLTGWYWVCLVAALVSTASLVVAVVVAPGWPAMGSRYDAPTGGTDTRGEGGPVTEQEMWRALDDGHDPTA
jgi:uncharacterized membrane protein (TIGR02234 family)